MRERNPMSVATTCDACGGPDGDKGEVNGPLGRSRIRIGAPVDLHHDDGGVGTRFDICPGCATRVRGAIGDELGRIIG